ncbi:unnamed protein product, partial [Brassica oleracea]
YRALFRCVYEPSTFSVVFWPVSGRRVCTSLGPLFVA